MECVLHGVRAKPGCYEDLKLKTCLVHSKMPDRCDSKFNNIMLNKDDIVELSVSRDGTWARMYGMISAIHLESGKVLDYEPKSKVLFLQGETWAGP